MFSPFRHMGSIIRKDRPIHFTFFVTRRCNAHCPFCFYREAGDTPPAADELRPDEIRRISGSLGSLLWLAFSGGEIFLRNDLPEIAKIFYQHNRPAIILFPTNGMLPELIFEKTREILLSCPRSVCAVKLSLDGVGEEHDRIRNTPESFRNTIRTYELLAGLLDKYPHFELGVNTVFCSENQDNMETIIDFVRGMDRIKTHTISLVRGDLQRQEFKAVDFVKYLAAVERLEQNLRSAAAPIYRFRGARIKAAQDIMQRRLIHRTLQSQRSLIPCYAGRLNLVLGETGEVYPCEILKESMGNVRDHGYDLGLVSNTPSGRRITEAIRDRRCFCTHECYFMTNILFNPRLYPELLREYRLIRQ